MSKILLVLKTISCVLLVEIIIWIFLSSLGFKFTYVPELENNWDAISAVGTLLASFFTLFAIFIAILIPQEDRKINSKIQLYNQRFELYYLIHTILTNRPDIVNLSLNEKEKLKKLFEQISYLVNKEDGEKLLNLVTKQSKYPKIETNNNEDSENNRYFTLHIDFEAPKKLKTIMNKYLYIGGYGI